MRTRKPCPGCGKNDLHRRADEVCSRCARSIEEWPKHIAAVKGTPDTVRVGLRGAAHWYPQFYFGGCQHNNELDALRSTLAQTFAALGARLCAEKLDWPEERGGPHDEYIAAENLFPVPRVRKPDPKKKGDTVPVGYPVNDPSYHAHGDQTGVIDRGTLELLRTLWDATARFTELAYLGGVEEGRNLLFQLAAGELTGQELAERDMRIAREIQDAKYLHRQLTKGKKKT